MIEIIVTSSKGVDRIVLPEGSYLNVLSPTLNEVVKRDEKLNFEVTAVGRVRMTVDEAHELNQRACSHNELKREGARYRCIRCDAKLEVAP